METQNPSLTQASLHGMIFRFRTVRQHRTLKTEYWKTSNQIEDIEMIVRSFEPDAESISQKRQRASKKRRIKLRVKPIVYKRVNYKERRANALALRAEERRDKLRKAAGRGKYSQIRRFLNGATHLNKLQVPCTESIGVRREPGELKHLSSRRKRK